MAGGSAPAPVPLFLDANGRRLFAVRHAPQGGPRGSVLMLPPFAEEQNMSRRMAYLLGRALAVAGFDFLLPDLTGTGESAGDFADARWPLWEEDARAARDWLRRESGTEPAILGLRAGALLAVRLQRNAEVPGVPGRLLLWQPVASGQTTINQFLRIRVAAGLMGGAKETTKELRDEWAAGRTVEVAGYEIHPGLAAEIDTLSLADMPPPPGIRTDWFEIGDDSRGPAPASQRIVEAWAAAGARVSLSLCAGEPFWTIQETTVAPAMIDATLAALNETADAA
ncbi:MAG: hydrolase 2, exosortase A system-associated [Rhodospirillaceae bacterium]